MKNNKPYASLSLDLDNLWSYMKTHAEPGWEQYPSYLNLFVPRVLGLLDQYNLKITFFVVGLDAIQSENHEPLRQIAQAGHEIGNHSFHHEPWMQNNTIDEIVDELIKAEEAILAATGIKPNGFRGPGFCYSDNLLIAIQRMGYPFDASILPSILGPIARLYYLWGARLSRDEKEDRKTLFGSFRDGFYPLKPFLWNTGDGHLLEIPVTTIPVFRVPFHLSYIIWLSNYSKSLALAYLKFAFTMCKLCRVEPSFLLHPLDFLGKEDAPQLSFFPGMNLSTDYKLAVAHGFFEMISRMFQVVPMAKHAEIIQSRGSLKIRTIQSLSQTTQESRPYTKTEAQNCK